MKNKISYIIVSYNVKEYLIRAIQSIYNYSTICNFEIIVIDNASFDDTVSVLENLFPYIRIIKNDINVGFSEANNQGFKIANGEYIFMLNPDAELKANAVEILLKNANNQLCLYAPYIENSDGTFQKSFWKTPTALTIFEEILFFNYIKKLICKPKPILQQQSVECVSGTAMFFHRSLLEKVGTLDPDLFWMDDTDFCYRIRKHNGQIVFVPEAKVVHHLGKSSFKNPKITISSQIISKIKFFKKHKMHVSYVLSIIFSFILIFEKIIIMSFLFFHPIAKKKLTAYISTLKKLIMFLIFNNRL